MARPSSPTLTEAELRLMKVVWERGPSSSGDVVQALSGSEAPSAESTVRTMLGILVAKGYLRAEREGRTYRYHALVGRGEAGRSAVRHLISRFFDGSPAELLLNVLRDGELDEAELERLRAMIESAEREGERR
ncbi:MAG TPA: BlaI/MecI/CopY family transcriptional regulator [Longimicrobiaceae bacterium]|nr:BlaI/MecI/CopY family transcriptional regulator [Longimicrobiaceae bacterium]